MWILREPLHVPIRNRKLFWGSQDVHVSYSFIVLSLHVNVPSYTSFKMETPGQTSNSGQNCLLKNLAGHKVMSVWQYNSGLNIQLDKLFVSQFMWGVTYHLAALLTSSEPIHSGYCCGLQGGQRHNWSFPCLGWIQEPSAPGWLRIYIMAQLAEAAKQMHLFYYWLFMLVSLASCSLPRLHPRFGSLHPSDVCELLSCLLLKSKLYRSCTSCPPTFHFSAI